MTKHWNLVLVAALGGTFAAGLASAEPPPQAEAAGAKKPAPRAQDAQAMKPPAKAEKPDVSATKTAGDAEPQAAEPEAKEKASPMAGIRHEIDAAARDALRLAAKERAAAERALLDARKAGDEKLITEAREALKEARAKALQELKDANKAFQEARRNATKKLKELTKEEREELHKKLGEFREKLKTDREKRREERVAAIKKEYGKVVERSDARAELRRHAWRLARLQQLVAIAEARGSEEHKARAEKLIEREDALHESRMALLAKTPAPPAEPPGLAKAPGSPAQPDKKPDTAGEKPAATPATAKKEAE